MKKSVLAIALATGFGVVSFTPAGAQASDGTITINGTVASATCTVTVNGTSGSTVTLPTVSTAVLASSGQTAGETAFSIGLSGCSGVTKAATYFEAGPNVNAAGRLVNNATGTKAGNVDVQLLNSDNSVISVGTAAPTSGAGNVAVSGSSATLSYFARYYATGASTAGGVSTSVQFSMVYN